MWELHNLRFPDGSHGALQVIGNRIVGIGSRKPSVTFSIDCKGWLVLPAGIDGHVHFRCPGGEEKETWQTGSLAALLGGITLVCDMPNTVIALTRAERVDEKTVIAFGHGIDFRFWFGATNDNLAEIRLVAKHPRVIGVKIYMGSSTGNLLVHEDSRIEQICQLCAELRTSVAMHCEDELLMQRNRRSLGYQPTIADHCLIRNTEVEVSAVRRALEIQRRTGVMMHFCHISCPESIYLIHAAKLQGRPVFVEVCPHHWIFSHEELWGLQASLRKMNPALRTPKQVLEMERLICIEGFVDFIATDHAPHSLERDKRGGYDQVASGVTGVQDSLALVYDLVARGKMSLQRFIDLTSANMAAFLGLNRGKIEVDAEAELLLIDPTGTTVISNATTRTKCGWTPYDGMILRGQRMAVVSQGRYYDINELAAR